MGISPSHSREPSREPQQAGPVAHIRVEDSIAEVFEAVDVADLFERGKDCGLGRAETFGTLTEQDPPRLFKRP
jgi:hypothetical protein